MTEPTVVRLEAVRVITEAPAADESLGPFMSMKSAAAYYDTTKGHVKNLHRSGALVAYRLAGTGDPARAPLRFRKSDLDKLIVRVTR